MATLLNDQFTTNDPAPVASPRTCEPGPGELVFFDTESKYGIASQKLVASGGKAAPGWGDPAWYGRNTDDTAFGRGSYFEIDFQLDASGLFQMFGWSNSTTLALANTKHCFFPLTTLETLMRIVGDSATGDTYVTHLYVSTVYTVRIYALSAGGALFLIKGGQYGTTFKGLGYSSTGSDVSIYPTCLNYNGQHKLDNALIVTVADPTFFYGYYNGATDVGALTYDIGVALSSDGISVARYQGNPVVVRGTAGAWDDAQLTAPYVLKDGAAWGMWFDGYDGSVYKIGYAEGSDGLAFTKDGGNPILSVGGAGAFDESGLIFPLVYKDNTAPANKRYRMLYAGLNASGLYQIGYAYAANRNGPWTKGGANPVVAVGAGGAWDDTAVLPGGLVKSGTTYYLFYAGGPGGAFPQSWQVGLVTFTDFEGTYTKSGSNPILANRSGFQALTANTNSGSTTVQVADTSAFAAGEMCCLVDAQVPPSIQQVRITSVDSGTQVTLAQAAYVNFTTANSSYLVTITRALAPRCVVLEDGAWKQWGAGFQIGSGTDAARVETTYYATGSAPDSGWAISQPDSPPLWLPVLGRAFGWDPHSAENLTFALDADTNLRVGFTPTPPVAPAPADESGVVYLHVTRW